MPYKVKLNKCKCKPDDCNCSFYRVVDEKDRTYTTIDDKKQAQTIADALNLIGA
jgi:hypothetical protein